MSRHQAEWGEISRRRFVQACAAGAAIVVCPGDMALKSLAAFPASNPAAAPVSRILPLATDWLFGGKYRPGSTTAGFDDTPFTKVNLPHAVTRLSWQKWDPAEWQDVWIYRKHFALPADWKGRRVFLQFDGVMVGVTPTINGVTLQKHLGGYLPARYELTEQLKEGDNVLAVEVDSRWSDVPPEGSPRGPRRVDYLEVGGIYRGVRLEAVPPVHIRDVFAKPVDVLDEKRRIDVACTIDAAVASESARIRVELRKGSNVVSSDEQPLSVEQFGSAEVKLTLRGLGDVALWHVDSPNLYEVVATLLVDDAPVHEYSRRVGIRDARFTLDGFFLNGKRLQLFGLNRHEIYPYVGGAMPPRVMRRDAQILRREFNCNIVRCSHYPQSEAFLDACDELGLMVWEEVPGWGYLGDGQWKDLLVRDVGDMIRRDRNHPSIVIWGTRANESANDVPLYRRTHELAKSLDDSRPTSGSMTPGSRRNWQKDWHEDVFAFDDYHSDPDGTVGIAGPTPGVPYMLAETVGQFNYTAKRRFDIVYRRAGDVPLQQQQALRHAQAHSKAAANGRNCGVIAWCGFDYSSLVNSFNNIKCPGVADVFRIPKPGAAFYLAQTDGNAPPIIQPAFYWDFGPSQQKGPGKGAAIFSNCDRLEVFIDDKHHATVRPDTSRYPHVRHAPFFVDLEVDGSSRPTLKVEGYRDDRLVLTSSFSSDPAHDQLLLKADDDELTADGSDATRVVFKVVDCFGADRLRGSGELRFELKGPGELVGDNPFPLADSGGVGAVWIRSRAGEQGRIGLEVVHSTFGAKSVSILARGGAG